MENFIHLFLPHHSNNYRSKVLHHGSLLFFIAVFFVGGFLLTQIKKNFPQVLGISTNIKVEQLISVTNKKRQENGLSPLKLDTSLSKAAQGKANDMFEKNYWAHNSPDGTTPWFFIKKEGYSYVYAGENLAKGFSSATEVVDAWFASPRHRENELSSNYQDVGFAVMTGKLKGEDTVLIVEEFGGKTLAVTPKSNSSDSASGLELPTTPADVASSIIGPSQKPLISSMTFSSSVYIVILAAFILVLFMDMVVIKKKRIVRISGHNIDHILFFATILLAGAIIIKGVIV